MPHRIYDRLLKDGTIDDLWSRIQQLSPEDAELVTPLALDRAKEARTTPSIPLAQRQCWGLIAQVLLHRFVFEELGLLPHPKARLSLNGVDRGSLSSTQQLL